jgi:hypothetical protein
MGASVECFAATGFGTAGLRTRFGFVMSACVGRIDFIVYGGIADFDRLKSDPWSGMQVTYILNLRQKCTFWQLVCQINFIWYFSELTGNIWYETEK